MRHGIAADEARAREYAEGSPSVATALNPVLGDEGGGEHRQAGARRAEEHPSGRDRPRGHVEWGKVSLEDLDHLLDVMGMTTQP